MRAMAEAEEELVERDDPALVAALRTGDHRAFEDLLRAHGGRLVSVARRILGNDDDAREAVHEAFVSAFKARRQFDGRSRLSTWLHRIAVNAALMKLRTRRRHPEQSIDELQPEFLPSGHHAARFTSWAEPADAAIARKEQAALVRRAIDRLPESYRTVLLLRDIDELSTDEAARVLDLTPNAVKIRLHRARLALRALIAPHFQGAGS
jgi:RNA polymerase sigma-70 factor (ECF subfamily)